MPQGVRRPFANNPLRARDRAAGCVFTRKHDSTTFTIRRKPSHQVWLNRNKPARSSFGFSFSNLNMSARKINIVPVQANKLRRSQSGKGPECKIKFGLLISGV